jgi:hypothetical protein
VHLLGSVDFCSALATVGDCSSIDLVMRFSATTAGTYLNATTVHWAPGDNPTRAVDTSLEQCSRPRFGYATTRPVDLDKESDNVSESVARDDGGTVELL